MALFNLKFHIVSIQSDTCRSFCDHWCHSLIVLRPNLPPSPRTRMTRTCSCLKLSALKSELATRGAWVVECCGCSGTKLLRSKENDKLRAVFLEHLERWDSREELWQVTVKGQHVCLRWFQLPIVRCFKDFQLSSLMLGMVKNKNYFTSSDPHRDIILKHIRHKFWHSFCPSVSRFHQNYPLLLVPSPGSGSSSDHCDLSSQTDSNCYAWFNTISDAGASPDA